jgi:CheY-like chemotaxis protein
MSSVSASSGVPEHTSLKQIEVLVVQSNPADTFLTLAAFESAGLTGGLRCVSEGQEALSYILRKEPFANAPVPNLIFLDLSEPRVSGLEVLKVRVCAERQLLHSKTGRASGVRPFH